MKTTKLLIRTNHSKYSIFIGSKLISNLSKIIEKQSIKFKKCLLVIDKNTPTKKVNEIKKKLNKKELFFHYIRANEKNKNQDTTNNILEILLKNNFSREDCLISVGGGITGDISGYAASLFKRGLKFINIPTTLLAQVDSSIGGKTGVNTKHGKNLIGSFYQPQLVISDIDFLTTLPKREVICGYGEILKHSLISNKKLFKFLNKNFKNILACRKPYIVKAIFESCKIKKRIVEEDEREKNTRKVLNFGHTFGHAYEASLGFSRKLNHGEAIILGMSSALKFCKLNKILSSRDYDIILNHIKNNKLPNNIKKFFSLRDTNKILSFMMNDKKNITNQINLILLKKIGTPVINKSFDKNKIESFFKRELFN